MKQKTIAIIPARGGSKRVPNKNIIEFNGLPLLVHSIKFAQANSELIDDIYVSTDNEQIKKVARQYGAKVIDRPAELSGDFEPTVTAIKHTLSVIDDEVDNVVLLQATNPLRPKNLLKEAFVIFEKKNVESLFTVTRDYKKLGKIVDKTFRPYNYKIGQRSQDLEPLYYENGLLYITKATLINQDTIFNGDAYPLVTEHVFGTIDIDTLEDFDLAKIMLKTYNND